MATLLDRLLGNSKAIESAVDGVKSGIDALVYTEEEKADEAAEERKRAREMLIEWVDKTSGQNLARRVIALSITGVWLFQYVASWAMNMGGVWSDLETSQKLTQAVAVTTQQADSMTGAVMLILTFYFAAPHMGKVVDSAIERFSKSNRP